MNLRYSHWERGGSISRPLATQPPLLLHHTVNYRALLSSPSAQAITLIYSHTTAIMMLVHATLALCIAAACTTAVPVPSASSSETYTFTMASYPGYSTGSSTYTYSKGEMRTIQVAKDVALADPDRYLPATTEVVVSVVPTGEPVWYTTTETYGWK